MLNYIPTKNPFGLASPPTWFLTALAAYDPMLVLFASTCKPVYQMGRRARYGFAMKPAAHLPDTAVFSAHRVWPWKEVLPSGINFGWARILAEIPDYDTQRFADPAGTLDAAEDKLEAELDARIADGADQLAGGIYRTLGLIGGSRTGSGSTPEGAGYKRMGNTKPRGPRRRVHRPVDTGTGAMWSGR